MGNGVQSIEDLCADSLVNMISVCEEIRLSDAEILHFREAVNSGSRFSKRRAAIEVTLAQVVEVL